MSPKYAKIWILNENDDYYVLLVGSVRSSYLTAMTSHTPIDADHAVTIRLVETTFWLLSLVEAQSLHLFCLMHFD